MKNSGYIFELKNNFFKFDGLFQAYTSSNLIYIYIDTHKRIHAHALTYTHIYIHIHKICI